MRLIKSMCFNNEQRLTTSFYGICFSLSSGLPVKNPVQCQRKPVKKSSLKCGKKKKRSKRVKREDSDSEEECQPWMEEKKHKTRGRGNVRIVFGGEVGGGGGGGIRV